MKKFIICLIVFAGFQQIFAQVSGTAPSQVPEGVRRTEEIRDINNRMAGKNDQGMILDRDMTPPPPPLYKGRNAEKNAWEKDYLRAKKMLRPPASYYAYFADFLKEENTGLALIFPNSGCYHRMEISVAEIERCANIPNILGNGSFYSFRSSETANRLRLSNLHFINGRFEAGWLNTQGIISEIGISEIEDVTLDSPALKFINDYRLKPTSAEIKNEVGIFRKGIRANGFFYSDSAPVKPGSTYVLRSIGFRVKKDVIMRTDQTDLTVVFKIVDQEKDGGLILLWKRLRKSETKALEK